MRSTVLYEMTLSKDSDKECLQLQKQFRFAAFLSVVISTTALLGSVLSVPMFYHYALRINNMAENDWDFCKVKTKTLWSEVVRHARRWKEEDRGSLLQRSSRKAVWSFVNPKLDGATNTNNVQANFDENLVNNPQFKDVEKYSTENELNAAEGKEQKTTSSICWVDLLLRFRSSRRRTAVQ